MPKDLFVPAAALALLCLTAAWYDLRLRRIPNWLCLLTAVAGLAYAAMPLTAGAPWWSFLLHGAVALVVGMGLFAIRWVGGGDAKFYAALACWFPFGRAPLLLIAVALSGLLLLIVWFTVRRLQGKKFRGTANDDAAKLPYGIAIALGAMLAFAT